MAGPEHNDETRRAMLAAIRQQLAASAPFDAVRAGHHALHEPRALRIPVVTAYDEQAVTLVERFRQALEAVSGRCTVVRNENEAAIAVQQTIDHLKAQRLAVTNSPVVQRVMQRVIVDAAQLENADPRALFDCDVGITSAQWAIAETGTLVLESEQERHRLPSLVPPVHIAIIEAGQIRQTLGEVLRSISESGPDGLSRTVTFITGPSRTSDIELTLAIGVHGPAELHVIILDKEAYE